MPPSEMIACTRPAPSSSAGCCLKSSDFYDAKTAAVLNPCSCCSLVVVFFFSPFNEILMVMKLEKDVDQVPICLRLNVAEARPCVESELSSAVVGAWCIVLPVH